MLRKTNKLLLWSGIALLLMSAISCTQEEFPKGFNEVTERLQTWSLEKDELVGKNILWDTELINY